MFALGRRRRASTLSSVGGKRWLVLVPCSMSFISTCMKGAGPAGSADVATLVGLEGRATHALCPHSRRLTGTDFDRFDLLT